ncbi:MAG: hypothetical protein A2Y40_07065 [Candidatus Margulisbacteria bacterium GWF2_35_9]|nr:MAG: hypothetical protein A2Y40_07065 [Candidatus Margulisbacteria bacterium GWF2_35_9]
MKRFIKLITVVLVASVTVSFALESNLKTRLKDISRLEDVRVNQLIGYGLVVGLAGSGDGSSNKATLQGISNMLSNFGVQIDPADLDGKNVAAVMVTGKLNPFNVVGDMIDVAVSSIGKAKSLRGGVLLLTPLKGANGDVYAVAQGALSVGGFSVSNKGSSSMKNHTTSGRVPNGAIVEKAVITDLVVNDKLTWILDQEDFTTITNIGNEIKTKYPNLEVDVINASKFSIVVSDDFKANVVQLISDINNINVNTDMVAKIIINEKTGSVVMGGPIMISPVVIAHESLNISIKNTDGVSQPNILAGGDTTLVKGSIVTVEDRASQAPFKTLQSDTNTIESIVAILNNIGVSPQDIIVILQLMKEAGAIKAKLEIV